jgi:hypothetical protein
MTTLKEQIEEKGIILPFRGSNITFGKQPECTVNGETFPVEVREAIRDEEGNIIGCKDCDIEIDKTLNDRKDLISDDERRESV